MFKSLFIVLLTLTFTTLVYAHPDSSVTDTFAVSKQAKNIRISLLTCGAGNDAWQTFGHSAIRIVDSSKDSTARDLTYSFGMINWQDGSIQQQFLKGRLRVFLDVIPYEPFVREYHIDGRYVEEMELLLDEDQKARIEAYLEENALPENRYYTYNFLHDNCTIRIRDIFPRVLGPGFVYGQVIQEGINFTFYDVYNIYLRHKYWSALFSNVFLPNTNYRVSNNDIMFIPEFLDEGLRRATFNGKKVCGEKVIVTQSRIQDLPAIDIPAIILFVLLLLTVAGLSIPGLRVLGTVMSYVVLLLSTLTGLCILYTWFGTDYEVCERNYNILWAIPFNIILPFLPAHIKAGYSAVAMCLICVCCAVHVAGLQQIPLFELVPFWLSLLAVYGTAYRRSNISFSAKVPS